MAEKKRKPAKGDEEDEIMVIPEQTKKKRAAKVKAKPKGDQSDLDDDFAEQEELEDANDRDHAAALPGNAKKTAIIGTGDFTGMVLKPDHQVRPIWVCPDGHVFLETFSPLYKHAYDFLIAIAEPVCRPALMHEYHLTSYSLYAAASIGLKTEDIISVLERLSKVKLPPEIKKLITESTQSYGKVKLVLQRNRYWIESAYPNILAKLAAQEEVRISIKISDDVIRDPKTGFVVAQAPQAIAIPGGGAVALEKAQMPRLLQEDEDEEGPTDTGVQSFEIDPERVMAVKRACVENDYPVLEEYDFRNDTINPDLKIDLKPTTMIRSYQEKSLSKMFGNGRARSGIIVLPCGAGKTLVGITACCTVKKSCLVLCTSGVSVEQWKHQFKIWSNIDDKLIARFTSDTKEKLSDLAAVTITTYTMVAFGGQRSAESLKIMNQIRAREWGLLLLDEVHVVPAHMFRKVLDKTKAHTKLGLTATLVREDDKIEDLNFLIGPKLYEANWLDLQKSGHIANVQCAEVWCPMTPEFYREYLISSSESRKRHLYVMNPNKLHACQYLIQYHEARGDRIIVFSDDVYALLTYAKKLGKLFIYGPTAGHERLSVLHNFQHNPQHRTIFISKVGDTSIDLPEATVIIQISSHYGSRRQEAQRLGRILRPKPRSDEEHNAFFYSLVSQDTNEMYYSTKRQQFLIDQGYAFKVITHLSGIEKMKKLLPNKKDEIALLADVLTHDGDEVERLEEDLDDITLKKGTAKAKKRVGSGAFLSGGNDRSYLEVRRKQMATPQDPIVHQPTEIRHSLFKKRSNIKS